MFNYIILFLEMGVEIDEFRNLKINISEFRNEFW